MDFEKEKLEIEKRKLNIEKIKIKEGLFRTFSLILLTLGAGAGTLVYRMLKDKGIEKMIDIAFFIILLTIMLIVVIINFRIWLSIRRHIKE